MILPDLCESKNKGQADSAVWPTFKPICWDAAYNHPRLQPTKVVYLPSVLLLQYDDDRAVNDN